VGRKYGFNPHDFAVYAMKNAIDGKKVTVFGINFC
jgi:hypothetical protein